MKFPLVILSSVFLGAVPARSEEAASTVYIPGEISTGTFVSPAPPKLLPVMKVENATLLQEPGRSLAILRGEASKAPDLPPKASRLAQTGAAVENQGPVSEHATLDRPKLIVMGATVHSPSLSHAQWPHPRTGEPCEAVCGFDFGLLSGFTTFVHGHREHALILMHSRVAGSARSNLPADWPEPPVDGFVMIRGDAGGAEPLRKLVDLLHAERPRLEQAAAERERNRALHAASEQEKAAGFQNHTLWLRPHRGSRYLTTEGGAR